MNLVVSVRKVSICLIGALAGSLFLPAFAEDSLDKLLSEDLGPDESVKSSVNGPEAFVTIKTKGYLGLTSQSCKLTALMLARKVMSRLGTVTVTHIRFFGVANDSYREVTVEAAQVASLGSLLDSVDVSWHGTKPRSNPSSRGAPGDKWCAAGDIKFRVPEGWLIFPHPPQDEAGSHHTVLAKVRYKPQGIAEVIVRVHNVVYLKKQFEFSVRYFKDAGFRIISQGPVQNAKNFRECYQATIQRKIPGKIYDDWEKHIFFEAGGRVYSVVLNTSSSSSADALEQFQKILDSLQWEDHSSK